MFIYRQKKCGWEGSSNCALEPRDCSKQGMSIGKSKGKGKGKGTGVPVLN